MNRSEDKATLQKVFTNRFKAEIEKTNFKNSAVGAAKDLAIGVVVMIILGLSVFLPALIG